MNSSKLVSKASDIVTVGTVGVTVILSTAIPRLKIHVTFLGPSVIEFDPNVGFPKRETRHAMKKQTEEIEKAQIIINRVASFSRPNWDRPGPGISALAIP